MNNFMPQETKIINPHKVMSNEVTKHDVKRVYQEALKMYPLLNKRHGFYNKHFAISHQQITDKYPLRFFVVNDRMDEFKGWESAIILNPIIVRHTENTIDSKEACMSFSKMPMRTMQRWNKCEVRFSFLLAEDPENEEDPKPFIGPRITKNFNGILSRVCQHEIDHFACQYIYNANIKLI